jgi:hypothetical protein
MSRIAALDRLWLRAAAILVAAFAYLHHVQFLSPYIRGYDGYYHIKFAALFPSLGFPDRFKWAAQSVWATGFADKELLYHLFLVPFTRFGDLATGVKFATVLLGAAVASSFYLILSLNRLRYPFLWTLLLFASGHLFLDRLGAPRPHVLSIVLLLWSVHLILNRRRRALAVVVFVYSLSYTAVHLPLALSLIVAAYLFVTERKIEWRTPLTVLGATVAGVLINPYFPNNLDIFWLQNFAVPWMAVAGGVVMRIGGEFQPWAPRELILAHLAVLVPFAGAVCLTVVRPRPTSARTGSLFVLSTTFILMTLLIGRFIEDAVPLTLFFLASFYTDRFPDLELREALKASGPRRSRAIAVTATVGLLVAGLLFTTYREALPLFEAEPPMRREAALYLRDHTEPDELIFTCDWDDTPELFFFNDHNRYLVLLDPNFMYFHDPELWREWFSVAHGGFGGRTYDILARDYRYGVCTYDFEHLKRIVEGDPRMEIVHDTGWTYVFRVDAGSRWISSWSFRETPDWPVSPRPRPPSRRYRLQPADLRSHIPVEP